MEQTEERQMDWVFAVLMLSVLGGVWLGLLLSR